MAGASAADNVTAPAPTIGNSSVQIDVEQTDITTNQSTAASAVNNSTDKALNLTTDSGDEKAAAGTTKTVSTTTFTLSQIKDAATRVKSYVETNKQLPTYVTIGGSQVQMSDFLKLLTTALVQINNGETTSITLQTVNDAVTPTETIKSGTITKAGYLDIAKRVNAFIDANGRLPNYVTSSLGKIRSETLIDMFSRVLSFHQSNNRLPNYVSVTPGITSNTDLAVPDSLKQYLASTANCEVTNAQIQALAASITSGKTSSYAKAEAIFNWVRDNIDYSFYYNTKNGAVGTLNAKTGNCVDTSHLLIALCRAVGIPARYQHATCKFTSGTYGHVWAQIWVNGVWYNADASSSRNYLGVINSWTLITLKGTYTSLPF
jgi:transglutaminase-like putative cysteine protease